MLREQARLCRAILRLMHEGALLLDEVDLILHPLKVQCTSPTHGTMYCAQVHLTAPK